VLTIEASFAFHFIFQLVVDWYPSLLNEESCVVFIDAAATAALPSTSTNKPTK